MSFTITLENELNEAIESIVENNTDLVNYLPEKIESNGCCIKYIDRYGITVFNRLQMDDFIKEIGLLKVTSQDKEVQDLVDQIIKLAEECKRKIHLYIKFYGD
jgi:hypothetical protein